MPLATRVSASLDLGWLVVCLPASDFKASMDFYERAGFVPVGGQPEHGWVVMGAGPCEINPMQDLPGVWINFRGADIDALRAELQERGFGVRDGGIFDPEKWPNELWHDASGSALPARGSGDFFIDDPDGNVIYFDTVPTERVRQEAGEPHSAPGFDGQWREGQPRLGDFELVLKVTDLERSVEFYQRLGLDTIETTEATVLLGSADHSRTRIRLRRSESPGVLLRFVNVDAQLGQRFRAEGLAPELHESKLILNSPDGLRLKFLF